MNCKKCGKELKEDWKYCNNCGEKIDSTKFSEKNKIDMNISMTDSNITEQEKLMIIYEKVQNNPFVLSNDTFSVGDRIYGGINDEEAFINTFWVALYNYVIKNIDNSEKTIMFFKNIANLDIERSENYELEQRFNFVMKHAQHEAMKWGKSYEQEILSFLQDIECEYNLFVNPTNKLTYFANKSTKTETIKRDKKSKVFLNVIIPIICLVISLHLSSSNDDGEWLFWFICSVFSVIWLFVGIAGTANSCSKCGKWNSLKVVEEEILDTFLDTEKKVEYTSSGNRHYRYETVTKEKVLQTLECQECGEITQKVITRKVN